MTGAIGRLTIDLSVRDGQVVPRIAHKPGLPVAALLIGRPREQAVTLIPAVLNLCAAAHRQAAGMAVGLAGGDGSGSRWETIRDHALAILRDWPSCLGFSAETGPLGEISAITTGRDRDGALTALRQRICGARADLGRFGLADLDRWLAEGETPTARLLAAVRHRFDPAWGRATLPAPTPDDIADCATGGALPAREVTVADRVRNDTALAEVEAREGRSLFARLLGRVLDLLRGLDGRDAVMDTAPAGFGVAEASRGRLVHAARLEGDIIRGYRIVTPTDWALADDGLLHRMLTSLPANEHLEPAARLALACVDPCIPAALRVSHA